MQELDSPATIQCKACRAEEWNDCIHDRRPSIENSYSEHEISNHQFAADCKISTRVPSTIVHLSKSKGSLVVAARDGPGVTHQCFFVCRIRGSFPWWLRGFILKFPPTLLSTFRNIAQIRTSLRKRLMLCAMHRTTIYKSNENPSIALTLAGRKD